MHLDSLQSSPTTGCPRPPQKAVCGQGQGPRDPSCQRGTFLGCKSGGNLLHPRGSAANDLQHFHPTYTEGHGSTLAEDAGCKKYKELLADSLWFPDWHRNPMQTAANQIPTLNTSHRNPIQTPYRSNANPTRVKHHSQTGPMQIHYRSHSRPNTNPLGIPYSHNRNPIQIP